MLFLFAKDGVNDYVDVGCVNFAVAVYVAEVEFACVAFAEYEIQQQVHVARVDNAVTIGIACLFFNYVGKVSPDIL